MRSAAHFKDVSLAAPPSEAEAAIASEERLSWPLAGLIVLGGSAALWLVIGLAVQRLAG